MKKQILVSILLFCMTLTLMPTTVLASNGTMEGAGTLSDPYLIEDADDFAAINTYGLDSHYKLANDIAINNGLNNTFTGSFDGDGHSITLGSTTNPATNGVFSTISGATIQNTNVEGAINTTQTYVGGIAKKLLSGTIKNCSYSGNITASTTSVDNYVGGIVGEASGGQIQCCYSEGIINTSSNAYGHVGGICSHIASTAVITTCHSSCDITLESSSFRAGGLVGIISNGGTLKNSYYLGTLSLYSTSSLNTHYNATGLLLGYIYHGATINNCFYLTNSSNTSLYAISYNDKPVYYSGVTAVNNIGSFTSESDTELESVNYYSDAGTQVLSLPVTGTLLDNLNSDGITDWQLNANTNDGYPYLTTITDVYPTILPLTGTVDISGSKSYNSTLTATITGNNNTGTIAYQWKRGGTDGTDIGTNQATYQLTESDIGGTITCIVTSSIETGSIFNTTSAITKAVGPAAPTNLITIKPSVLGASDGKITGVTTLMEYDDNSLFSSPANCTSTEITGLTSGTYYVRIKETSTTEVGSYSSITIPSGDEQIYSLIKGANSSWTQGNKQGNSLIFNASYFKFTKLSIDDITIAQSQYTVENNDGNTIITLSPELLNKLTVGSHKVYAVYSDGHAQTTLSILPKEVSDTKASTIDNAYTNSVDNTSTISPHTSDSFQPCLLYLIILISVVGITLMLRLRLNNNNK